MPYQYRNTRTVRIPDASEQDLRLVFPDGAEWTLQYRNYGDGRTLDILLDRTRQVYNWNGVGMRPAKALCRQEKHVLYVDQICIPLE